MKLIAKGIPIVSGFSVGKVYFFERENILSIYAKQNCTVSDIQIEINRLRNSLNILKAKIEGFSNINKEVRDLLSAHALIAETIISEAEEKVREKGVCAESAIALTIDKYIHEFQESGSTLISLRIDDLIDIGSQLINILLNKPLIYDTLLTITEKIILITDYVLPSEVILFHNSGLVGLITKHGGVTAHSAILARTFNIPYIILPELNEKIISEINDKFIAIDGYNGSILLPSNDEIRMIEEISTSILELNNRFYKERSSQPITLDGKYIKVLANIGNVEESRVVLDYGGEGIGLLRLEFLYMNRRQPPNEDELYNVLRKISEYLHGKEVIVRALDAGGDKPIPYLTTIKENNPFLGLRGIRLLLKEHEELLIDEIKAVLKASVFGEFGFMIPMVSTIDEILTVKKLIDEVKEDLDKHNIKYGKFSFGIMIEVPSIALIIDKVVKLVDFVSLGTNDLTQYTLAVDRDNERVQYLYDDMRPSILRLIYNVAQIAKAHNVRVDVCGELAGNEIATPILLALGVDALSMNPVSIPKVKYIIRRLNINSIRDRIIGLLHDFDRESDIRTTALSILIKAVPELKDLMKIYENYKRLQQP